MEGRGEDIEGTGGGKGRTRGWRPNGYLDQRVASLSLASRSYAQKADGLLNVIVPLSLFCQTS